MSYFSPKPLKVLRLISHAVDSDRKQTFVLMLLILTGNKLLLNLNNRADTKEQKNDVDESSKSPAWRKNKTKETPFYTFRRKTLAINQHRQYIIRNRCFLNRQEPPLNGAITCCRSVAIAMIIWKYISLFYLHRKIALLLRRILRQTPLVWRARELDKFSTSLWRRITLPGLRRDHWLAT